MHQAIIDKLGSFFSARNPALLYEIYAEDAGIWHNYDQKAVTVQELAEAVRVLFDSFPELDAINVRTFAIDKGFVQQYDIVGTHVSGASVNFPAIRLATVEAGKIVRLEEYFDPAPLTAIISGH